jgi:hypothetical protein
MAPQCRCLTLLRRHDTRGRIFANLKDYVETGTPQPFFVNP